MITEIYAHAARHSRIPEVRDCTADGKPVLAVSDGDSIKNEWQHATQSDAEPDGFSYLSFQGVPRTLTRVTRDSPSRLPQGLAGPPQRALRHLLALSGLFTWVHEDKIEKATSIAEGVGLFVTLKNNDLFLVSAKATREVTTCTFQRRAGVITAHPGSHPASSMLACTPIWTDGRRTTIVVHSPRDARPIVISHSFLRCFCPEEGFISH